MTDVWAPPSDATAFARVAAALSAGDSEHLPTLLDVTALGERRELLLDPADGPTLAALLSRRPLAPGEAVTVVVSVTRAVAALHRAGYCGAELAPEQVRFDCTGRPLLFGLAGLRETIQVGAEGTAEDWRGLAALAERVGLLMPTRGTPAFGAQHTTLGLAVAALGGAESAEHLAQLEEALFDLAEPVAIRLEAEADAPSAAASAGALTPALSEPPARTRALHRRPSGSVLIEAFDAGPAALLAQPLERLRNAAATARARVHGRGRLMVIAAGATAVLTILLVVLLPTAPPRHPAAPRGATAAAPATPAPAPSARGTDALLTGSDPVAAASVLIARRDACLTGARGLREACLEKLADGAAAALDQPTRPLAGLSPSLLEQSGNSALIALTPKNPETAPASALLMRTEAGWRLRQLYEN